ncbi:MAG: hypothetical protein AAFP19_01750 [Bacteroidota bacterium]
MQPLTLNKEIQQLYEKVKKKEKVLIHLRHIEELINKYALEIEALEKRLVKEEEDIKQLERLNLHSLFLRILGNIDEQLEKERQEYLKYHLRREALIDKRKSLIREKNLLERVSRGDQEERLEVLLEKKLKQLKEEQAPQAEAIIEVENRLAHHKITVKEIRQSVREAYKTKRKLQSIMLDLSKVETWGRGPIKGSQTKVLERLKSNAFGANNLLQRFEGELHDLADHCQIDYLDHLSSIRSFLEDFIDGLVTDWVIKSEIVNAKNIVSNVLDKLTLLISMLDSEIEKTREFVKEDNKERRRLVVKA